MSCTLEKGLQRVSLVSNLCPRPPGLLCPRTSLVPLPDGVQEDVDQNDEKQCILKFINLTIPGMLHIVTSFSLK